jgi:hypothetical protein
MFLVEFLFQIYIGSLTLKLTVRREANIDHSGKDFAMTDPSRRSPLAAHSSFDDGYGMILLSLFATPWFIFAHG